MIKLAKDNPLKIIYGTPTYKNRDVPSDNSKVIDFALMTYFDGPQIIWIKTVDVTLENSITKKMLNAYKFYDEVIKSANKQKQIKYNFQHLIICKRTSKIT